MSRRIPHNRLDASVALRTHGVWVGGCSRWGGVGGGSQGCVITVVFFVRHTVRDDWVRPARVAGGDARARGGPARRRVQGERPGGARRDDTAAHHAGDAPRRRRRAGEAARHVHQVRRRRAPRVPVLQHHQPPPAAPHTRRTSSNASYCRWESCWSSNKGSSRGRHLPWTLQASPPPPPPPSSPPSKAP